MGIPNNRFLYNQSCVEQGANKKSKMKNLKIYEVAFDPILPAPSGLIVLARSNAEAMKIARETIKHTEPEKATLIKLDKPKVIFYESGDY